jgi:hypothetical protein
VILESRSLMARYLLGKEVSKIAKTYAKGSYECDTLEWAARSLRSQRKAMDVKGARGKDSWSWSGFTPW